MIKFVVYAMKIKNFWGLLILEKNIIVIHVLQKLTNQAWIIGSHAQWKKDLKIIFLLEKNYMVDPQTCLVV